MTIDENNLLVIPDVHGQKPLLDLVLQNHPDRHYIFLGDLIDRGSDSRGCLQTAIQLATQGRASLCIGNHELMAWSHYFNKEHNWWSVHGLPDCKKSYDSERELQTDLMKYMKLARHYHTVSDMLFAHAGVPLFAGDTVIGEAHLWDRPNGLLKALPDGIHISFHGHTPMTEIKYIRPSDGSVRVYSDLGLRKLAVIDPASSEEWIYQYSE